MNKKFWIQSAIQHKGALRKSMGIKVGRKIPTARLRAAAAKGGITGKRARLALTLRSFH